VHVRDEHVAGDSRRRGEQTGEEATRKACGVLDLPPGASVGRLAPLVDGRIDVDDIGRCSSRCRPKMVTLATVSSRK
jgi:hypothetical protein